MSYINCEIAITHDDVESAKRSLIYEIVSQEKTVEAAALQSLLHYFNHTPLDFNQYDTYTFVYNVYDFISFLVNYVIVY